MYDFPDSDTEDTVLFKLSMEDACLQDNPNVKKALVPFEQLEIKEEIGHGWYTIVDPLMWTP